jgi:lipid II:glycine glycyltransferase (peptidoglycan interpeptide bridge formation enzyme)
MLITEGTTTDRRTWDDFVERSSSGSFLQSWLWGDFQQAAGFQVLRLKIAKKDSGDLLGICLLVERKLPFHKAYWYAPWGPVLKDELSNEERFLVLNLLRANVSFVSKNHPIFLRIEPHREKNDEGISVLMKARFSAIGTGVQPKDTLLLDLRQNEDDLLRGMHSKTRYNIRVAIRHGITVSEKTNKEGLEIFMAMAQEIQNRGGFHYHTRHYYQKMLEVLGSEQKVRLLVALYKNEPLAAGIFIKFGKTYTYAHGASFKKKAHVMAPHFLHWEAILQAKKEGFEWYDFFGIAPNENPKHPWAGISRFKRGFGGQEKNFIGAADGVFDVTQYKILNIGKALREILHK